MKLLPILALLMATVGHAETLEGRIIGITDGDTVTILDGSKSRHRIRLAGIDAPEKKQAFGKHSKESLSGMVFGQTVAVETGKIDRYERTIGKSWSTTPMPILSR
jgi:endonuclease YncB( thermonuclease family)